MPMASRQSVPGSHPSPWDQLTHDRRWIERTIYDQGDDSNREEDETPQQYFSDGDDVSDDEEQARAGSPTLELRQYQKELSETALQGYNTIICAPTGSGKTRVATHIIMEHLKKNDGCKKKVAFLARTVPLAVQQYRSLCKYLPSYQITHITGESDQSMSLHLLLPHNDVIVMTPMILVNHITIKAVPHLGVFSMLVFDECHHTRKGEPYNTLMSSYLKIKDSQARGERSTSDIRLPQIVGLTASIGIEKAVFVETAKDSILEVCGNLDVYKMSTVQRNVDELKSIVPVPEEITKQLREREDDEAVYKINQIMEKLETHLQHHVTELRDSDLTKAAGSRPANRKKQQYGQWAVEVKKNAKKIPIHDAARETNISIRSSIIISDYLADYNVALETHDLVELKDVMEYLEKRFWRFKENEKRATGEDTFYSYFQEFQDLVRRRHEEENPNLTILAETLMEYLVEEGSCGIIFVRTRALAEALASWLNRCGIAALRNLNAHSFTGANASEDQGGMSQAQQEGVIQLFRLGEIRLLVATSVAEEGLDIPRCNLVVKYNHVGNEVTSVQTRGRSRAIGGVSVLLAMRDVLERECINRERAKLMEQAIEMIRGMSTPEIKRQVDAYQKRIIDAGRIAELEEESRRQRLKNVPFRMVCSLCRKVAVDGSHVKTIFGKYRVSTDWNFMKNHTEFKKSRKAEKMDELLFVGNVICKGEPGEHGKKCANVLGTMISYNKIPFVTLGIKNFGFDTADKKALEHFKQWKKVPYVVEELNYEDIRRYLLQSGVMPHNPVDEDDDDDDDSDDDDDDDHMMNSRTKRGVSGKDHLSKEFGKVRI